MSRKSLAAAPNAATLLLRVSCPFALAYFFSYLFRSVNAVIAPELTADLGLTPADLGLLTAAYFLSFALAQLPVGLLLDRYGPRRVEAGLLLFAAVGAGLFGRAESLTGLVVGRALIGLGVSACLMAAFRAFALWYPVLRLPLVNGLQMAAGGLGALAATAPTRMALNYIDWRGIFGVLAGLTLLVALVLFRVVPERPTEGAGEPLKDQLHGLREIFTSRIFWRITPWTVACQAAYLAIQGLWSGPWLRDVSGLGAEPLSRILLAVAAAMIAGYLLAGLLTERLAQRGIPGETVAAAGMTVFMAVQGLLIISHGRWPFLVWGLFGVFGTASILPYAILTQSFPRRLAGRVSTALNMLVFLAAFAVQWGIGAIIGLWPETAGRFAPASYQTAFALLLALQGATWAWYLYSGWNRLRPEQAESQEA